MALAALAARVDENDKANLDLQFYFHARFFSRLSRKSVILENFFVCLFIFSS